MAYENFLRNVGHGEVMYHKNTRFVDNEELKPDQHTIFEDQAVLRQITNYLRTR